MSHPARSTLEPPGYDGHFVMISLTQGKYAIVDEADAELVLSRGKWFAEAKRNRTYYAARGEGSPKRHLAMHALIAGLKRPDHVNRNGLDNRRINLRPASHGQNSANIAPPRNNTSGYKGVVWHKKSGAWCARIGIDGARKHLGLFDDPVEAARAYNRAAIEAFGEYAQLNPAPAAPDGAGGNRRVRRGRWVQGGAAVRSRPDDAPSYKGVAWHQARGRWVAYLSVDGRQKHLGCFDDPVEAARAYNRAAAEASADIRSR